MLYLIREPPITDEEKAIISKWLKKAKELEAAKKAVVEEAKKKCEADAECEKRVEDVAEEEYVPGALQKRIAASFVLTGKQYFDAEKYKEAVEDFTAALSFDSGHEGAKEGLKLAEERLGESSSD